MGAVTLTRLIDRSRSRADMPIVGFVTAAELLDWINEGGQQLHEKLVSAYSEEYVSTSVALTVASGVVALPAAFFKLLTIETDISGRTRTLLPYTQQERNAYKNALGVTGGLSPPRYHIIGSNIRLLPVPANGTIINITYAPEFTLLASGSDTVTFPNGWEKYIVAYAAKQMLDKEESDSRTLAALLGQWDQELASLKESRDAAAPKSVVDVEMVEADALWRY